MRRTARGLLALVIGTGIAVGAVPIAALGQDGSEVQSPADAREADLEAIASARGWTVQQARAQRDADDAIDLVARRVAEQRPDIFIGSALSKKPGGPPTLYIKGPAPKFVRDVVAEVAVSIKIVDEQPYSFEELETRKRKVHESLVEMGFDAVATRVNITGAGTIPASVLRTPGLPTDRASILQSVPAGLRSSVDLRVANRSYGGGDHALGGTKAWSTGAPANYCTSGWSVEHLTNGKKGVVSAGHCGVGGTINRLHSTDPHVMWWQDEHLGNWGDVEWYTTNTTEHPRFRASPSAVRDVLWRESIENIQVNASYCLYGATSQVQNCSLDVEDVSQACSGAGLSYDRLVLMDGDVGEPGDSGGPWFINNKAVGVHHGPCYTVFGDTFTPIDYLTKNASLQVRVMKQE